MRCPRKSNYREDKGDTITSTFNQRESHVTAVMHGTLLLSRDVRYKTGACYLGKTGACYKEVKTRERCTALQKRCALEETYTTKRCTLKYSI